MQAIEDLGIQYRTKQEIVVSRLRDAILDEQLPPGAWLRLRDLADMLGTSTMPIREAMRVLASEGLVIISPHRGAQVAPLSPEELEELYMARLGLDGLAARLGAEQIGADGLGRLQALLSRIEQAATAGDVAAFLELDAEFHAIHFGACGRPGLLRRLESLHKSCQRYTRRARTSLADTEATRRYHRGLLGACMRRDGALAEQIVRQDLESSVAYIRQHILDGEIGRLHGIGAFTLDAGHPAQAQPIGSPPA